MVLVYKILPTPKSTINNILFNKVTSLEHLHMTLLAIFNLRQKVYRCIYTHFDVSKIYKSLKSWSAITLNLNEKTKWVNGVIGQRVLPLLIFQYWSYDYFFTKNRYSWISHANLAIWWWRSSKISWSTVVDLCLILHVM